MKKHLLLLTAMLAILASCDITNLKETEYIDDTNYPGLPIYSDMGYNTFGTYINNETFHISTKNSDRPFYLVADHEGLILSLYGYYQNQPLTMTFSIPLDPDFRMEDYHDLIQLHGETYVIDTMTTTCRVELQGENAPSYVSIYSGRFSFDNIRQVVVDKEDAEVIVAGKFQFRAVKPEGSYLDVVGGRFDLGVDHSNFVNFRR